MKASLLVTAALGVLIAGCSEKSDKPAQSTNTASSGGSVLTAPVDYLGAVAKGQQAATRTLDAAYLNQAIQQFNTMEGRYPKDLNELAAQHYIGKIPEAPIGKKIIYDANTGTVKIVNQ